MVNANNRKPVTFKGNFVCYLDELVEAYKIKSNVWKVGEQFGLSGQKVHTELSKIGVNNKMNYFTEEEKQILREKYVPYKMEYKLNDLAAELGRTTAFINRQAKYLNLTSAIPILEVPEWFRTNTSINVKKWIAENGHPKGMLGKKHSAAFSITASEEVKSRWADPNSAFNTEEFRQKQSDNMSRWQNTRTDVWNNHTRGASGWFDKDGKLVYMRSSWELNYAHYLNFLVDKKEFISWEYEVDTFWFEKIKRGVRSYKPDFKIHLNNGEIEYHEVKGWMDDKSVTKLKRMALYYPDVKIRVIGKKEYDAVCKYSSLIPNWGKWETENPNIKKL